jgi:DNA-binding CsgD family transcriptional regulator
MLNNEDMMKFIFDKMPLGIIVYDKKLSITYSNVRGKHFLKRHMVPVEFTALSRKIFNAIKAGSLKKLFPGEIYLTKKLDKSSSKWTFKFEICEKPGPFVCIFAREDSVVDKLNLNEIRRQFGLTRRETDVLRRTLSGLKNAEVAEDLNISEQTVKDYLSEVYLKSRVKNKFELVSLILNFPEQGNTLNIPEFIRKTEVRI